MDFVTALLVDRHKRGRLRHRGGATTGMPMLPVIGLGVTVDWAKDSGNYDIVKTTGSNILSSGLENKFGHYTGFPLIKEAMTNSFEKYYEQLKETNKNEK